MVSSVNKGVAADAIFIMILIASGIIGLVLITQGGLEDIGRNFCVRDQFLEIRKIEEIASEMSLGMEKATSFKVKWCTKCIWYNPSDKSLYIIFKHEAQPAKRPVQSIYFNVGNSKSTSRLNNEDFDYSFWVRKGEVNCTNCNEVKEGC